MKDIWMLDDDDGECMREKWKMKCNLKTSIKYVVNECMTWEVKRFQRLILFWN